MNNINIFTKQKHNVNQNCSLARNGFTPYERCNYCKLHVKSCSGMHLNIFTLISGISILLFMFLDDPLLIRINILVLFGLLFAFGYKITVDTDSLARTDFINNKLNEELNQHSNLLEEEIQERTQELQQLATHDKITGLFNRYEFEKRLTNLLKFAPTSSSKNILCYLDLDQFKVVNDTSGHVAGDELLKQIAFIMQKNVGPNDIVSRLGGDEFGILFTSSSLDQAHDKALNILNAIKRYRFYWKDKIFVIGASMGLVEITRDSSSLLEVVASADAACYEAKEQGRNCIHVATQDDAKMLEKRGQLQWFEKLTRALEYDEFRLFIQPIVPLNYKETKKHYEVLIRLQNENKIIPPMAFIPAAERYGLMQDIDRWVIENLFIQYAKILKQTGISYYFSINLSGNSFSDKKLAITIEGLFKKYKIPYEDICFEVTESAAIANIDTAIGFINKMKLLGAKASLDDFGSGHSSFAYLHNIPVDYLKIDGAFVSDIDTNEINRAMVKSINEIGHIMGLKTICEYVENEAVEEILRDMNVDYAQGYYYSKPLPIEIILGSE